MAKIVMLGEQKALGMVYRGMNEKGEIPAMWEVFNRRYSELKPASEVCYGLCYEDPVTHEFAYMAGVTVASLDEVPEGMEVTVIPAGKYAVFTFKDHISKIRAFWDDIYTVQLKAEGLVPVNSMSFELYDSRFHVNGELDIYIPVL